MNDFWYDMNREYGDALIWKRTPAPFEPLGSTVAIRRKDLAEKLVAICLRNQLSLKQSLSLLQDLIELFRISRDSRLNERFKFLQGKSQQVAIHMETLIEKITTDVNEKKAIEEIIQLIKDENPSFAEIRGAAWEAILMLMRLPLTISTEENE